MNTMASVATVNKDQKHQKADSKTKQADSANENSDMIDDESEDDDDFQAPESSLEVITLDQSLSFVYKKLSVGKLHKNLIAIHVQEDGDVDGDAKCSGSFLIQLHLVF